MLKKNKKIILDASALLAFIDEEKGCEIIEEFLPDVVISSVNISEVLCVSARRGVDISVLLPKIRSIVSDIRSFDEEQAYIAAELYESTKKYGLSLGDRACLALSLSIGSAVITADKAWKNIKFKNDIIFLRG